MSDHFDKIKIIKILRRGNFKDSGCNTRLFERSKSPETDSTVTLVVKSFLKLMEVDSFETINTPCFWQELLGKGTIDVMRGKIYKIISRVNFKFYNSNISLVPQNIQGIFPRRTWPSVQTFYIGSL